MGAKPKNPAFMSIVLFLPALEPTWTFRGGQITSEIVATIASHWGDGLEFKFNIVLSGRAICWSRFVEAFFVAEDKKIIRITTF